MSELKRANNELDYNYDSNSTSVENSEEIELRSEMDKRRRAILLAITTVLAVICIFAVMFAYYDYNRDVIQPVYEAFFNDKEITYIVGDNAANVAAINDWTSLSIKNAIEWHLYLTKNDDVLSSTGIWGSNDYGVFFTQMYGGTFGLGFAMFFITVASITSGTIITAKKSEEHASISVLTTFFITMILGMVLAGTICIYVFGSLSIIIALSYIIRAKTVKYF